MIKLYPIVKQLLKESESVYKAEIALGGGGTKKWWDFLFDENGNIIDKISNERNYEQDFDKLEPALQKKFINAAKKDFELNYKTKNSIDWSKYNDNNAVKGIKNISLSDVDFSKLKVDDLIGWKHSYETISVHHFIITEIKPDYLVGYSFIYRVEKMKLKKSDDVIVRAVIRKS